MFRSSLFLGFLLTSLISFSQSYSKKYGIEVNGGIREYHGDLGSALFFSKKPEYQAVGLGFHYYLTPSFDASLYGSSGDLGFYTTENEFDGRRKGFRARITDAVLGLNYKFNNGYLMAEDAKIKPYIRAGWGGMQSVSLLDHNEEGYANNRTWFAVHWNAGLGLRYALTNFLDVTAQSLMNYSFDDNYDGSPFTLASAKLNIAEEGGKPLHDIYMYHSLGFVYNFGESGGGPRYKFDADTDGDGVPDKFDKCPETPNGYKVDSLGCPLDNDGDGIVNEEDECPDLAGTLAHKGCPDFESGIEDEVNLAAKGIFFETSKDVIKSESFENLNKLATILNKYRSAKLIIEGHTDSEGDADMNQTLSQNRANAVKKYLANKGVANYRMKAIGFGETQPLGDNETEEGRALNRRVQFKLDY